MFWTLPRRLLSPCGKRHAVFGEGGRQSKEEAVAHRARNKTQRCLRNDGTGWGTRDICHHPLCSRRFYVFMASWCQNQFQQSFSFPSRLELLLPRHSLADFQHLHISEGLCFTQCSQADSFSKLRIMQRAGTSTALIKVKMKNPFLGFLWEYTRWCHGCLLRQCVITFLVLPEKLKKATWVLLYHLPPSFHSCCLWLTWTLFWKCLCAQWMWPQLLLLVFSPFLSLPKCYWIVFSTFTLWLREITPCPPQ